MSIEPIEVTLTDIGGVPALWAPSDEFMGALTFRVGVCDETLPTTGITHLVEHLAFPDEQVRGLEVNGAVDPWLTEFWAAGPRDAVCAFLEQTARTLQALPAGRIEKERGILLTEMEKWSAGPFEYAAALRFGATSHGLCGYQQFGLRHLTIDDAQAWSDVHFTKGNLVLSFLGEPPTTLDLGLPVGERRPAPAATPVAGIEYPCESDTGADGGVAVVFVARRSLELAAAMRIMENRLVAQLRYGEGLSYEAGSDWRPMNATDVQCILWADARDNAGSARIRDLIEEIARDFSERGPTAEELGEARQIGEHFTKKNIHGLVGTAAHDLSFGYAHRSSAEWIRLRSMATSDGIRDAFAAAYETRIVLIPEGCRKSTLPPFPLSSPTEVDGTSHKSKGLRPKLGDQRLIAGPEGITVTAPGARWTVRFDDCVGGLGWHDGNRVLFGSDGKWVEFDPALWRDADEISSLIEQHVPSELVIPMDPEFAERKQQVDAAIDGKVRRSFLTSRDLDLLPHVLHEGEEIRAAARADLGGKAGVLVVTPWRAVFLFGGDLHLEFQHTDISGMATRPGSQVLGLDGKLKVTVPGGTHAFSIASNARLRELEAALRRGE